MTFAVGLPTLKQIRSPAHLCSVGPRETTFRKSAYGTYGRTSLSHLVAVTRRVVEAGDGRVRESVLRRWAYVVRAARAAQARRPAASAQAAGAGDSAASGARPGGRVAARGRACAYIVDDKVLVAAWLKRDDSEGQAPVEGCLRLHHTKATSSRHACTLAKARARKPAILSMSVAQPRAANETRMNKVQEMN